MNYLEFNLQEIGRYRFIISVVSGDGDGGNRAWSRAKGGNRPEEHSLEANRASCSFNNIINLVRNVPDCTFVLI